ncbi:unnamed protein product [Caenorhabditis nigoni]
MADNKSGKDIPGEGHKTETHGTVEIMITAGTEEINNSHERKFDEITEKLQATEESAAKILKTNEGKKIVRFVHGEFSVNGGIVSGLLYKGHMYNLQTAPRRCEGKNGCLSADAGVSDIVAFVEANLPEVDLAPVLAHLENISINFSK